MRLMENSVLMRVSFSRLGNIRKADLDKVTTDADKGRLKLGKVLFVSDEYAAISAFDTALTLWVQRRAIPCDIGYRGVSVLPLALLGVVEQRFEQARTERELLVTKFLQVYDSERDIARQRLNGQFSEADYPSVDSVRAEFGFRWTYVTFEVPKNLPEGLRDREGKKLQEKFEAVEVEVRDALRSALADLLGHLTDRLKVDEDGKPKIFRDSAVGNLIEFLELFRARDVTNDVALAALANKAQAVIRGVGAGVLREPGMFRDKVRENLAAVKSDLDKLIIATPRRKFDLA